MNRLTHMMILAAISFVLIGGVAIASMYWDQSQDPDDAMAGTAQKARSLDPSPSTTPAKPVKMYDDNQVLDVDSFDEPVPARTPRIQPEPPAVQPAPAQRRRVPPSPARQSVAPRAQGQDVERVRPQPVPSSPGKVEEKQEANTGEPAVIQRTGPTKELEAAPPVTKRMPWGRTEMKLEPKTNLEWGRPR